MALAGKILGERFNKPDAEIFNYNVFSLAGDGCIMEGVAHEACSLAGHLGLSNFTILYDANDICLIGDLEVFSRMFGKGSNLMVSRLLKLMVLTYLQTQAFGGLRRQSITDKPQLIICKTTMVTDRLTSWTTPAHGYPWDQMNPS